MQSFLLSALVASSALLSATYAQVYPAVNVTAIPLPQRNSYCTTQVASCKLLCQNQELHVTTNECFPDNLYFSCICSDGKAPNVTEYSQTIPYFTCTLEVEGCVKNCKGDSGCQFSCAANKPCGASNPTRVNATTTTTGSSTGKPTSSSTGTAAVDENGFAVTGNPAPSGTNNSGNGSGASRLLEVGSVYGMGLLVAGMAAGVVIVGF